MNTLLSIALVFLAANICCQGQQVLNCYKCASGMSWKECAYKQQETKCNRERNKCVSVKFDGRNGETGFVRDCVLMSSCDKNELPQCRQAERCEFDCCSGDLCNSSSATRASGLLLLTCVVGILYMIRPI